MSDYYCSQCGSTTSPDQLQSVIQELSVALDDAHKKYCSVQGPFREESLTWIAALERAQKLIGARP